MDSSLTGLAKILSVQVGLPVTLQSEDFVTQTDKPWTTGFVKEPIVGPVWLGSRNLSGDGQADSVHHGGPDKAVCVYPACHYPFWRDELHQPAMQCGAFGENFTVDGLTEADVCIGDVWRVGDATVQVSQPRQPCWKLARRWNIKDLALRVQQHGRTGWYLRVLVEGFVASGVAITLVERTYADWTIAAANRIMHHDKTNVAAAANLAAIPPLSSSWRESLLLRIQTNDEPRDSERLNGTNNLA